MVEEQVNKLVAAVTDQAAATVTAVTETQRKLSADLVSALSLSIKTGGHGGLVPLIHGLADLENDVMFHEIETTRVLKQAASELIAVLLPMVSSHETHSKSSPEIRRAVLALTDGKCTYCDVELIDGGQASNSFVVEHVVPASKGGPDNLVNYVPACQSCNISKRDGHVLDFIKRRQGGNVTTLQTLPKREAAE